VEAEELRLIEVSNGGYARKQEECEEAKNHAAAARTEYESYQQRQPSLRAAIKSAESKEQDAKKQCALKTKDLNQADNRLRELTKENSQLKDGFPNKTQALLRAIQQERSFASPPVGPIGRHVTLLKPKWASVIESTLGNTLSSFVVKTHGDQKILSGIMKRVGW
jgi:chromosome segregation ATPase